MSYLGTTLKAIIEANDTTARAVAKNAGLDESAISRWINGSRSVSVSALSEVARTLGRDKRESAEIVAAHLRDLCSECGVDSVSIQVNGKSREIKTPASLDSAIESLRRKSVTNAKLRNLLTDLDKLC